MRWDAAGMRRATTVAGTQLVEKPEVLWAPGGQADESQTQRLARKIGMLCRKSGGLCVVGSRGELPTARAMRALAVASEAEKAPVEFGVRWHEDPGDGRSLRFYAEMRCNWSKFRRRWDARSAVEGGIRPMPVTPNTPVYWLATALVRQVRNQSGAALSLNPHNNAVMNITAKALATMPYAAQEGAHRKDVLAGGTTGADLVCVLRWPKSHGAMRVYAHVMRRAVGEGSHDGNGKAQE